MTQKRPTLRTPVNLRETGGKLYRSLLRKYPELSEESAHFLLLKTAEAADIAALANAEVIRLGPNVVDPKGRVVKNPAVSAWKDAMNIIAVNYRLLGLQFEGEQVPRPPRKKQSQYSIGAK